jgi:hypothetical protein
MALIETRDLFLPSITSVAFNRSRYLPDYAFEFIELFAPRWPHMSSKAQ